LQHFLQIILSGSVEKASDQGGGVDGPAGDVEGGGVREDGGNGDGGGYARPDGEGGVDADVVIVGVFIAGVSYSPVEDREELSRALSEQIREMEDTWGGCCHRFHRYNRLARVRLRIRAWWLFWCALQA
jgi:hypothetical protein